MTIEEAIQHCEEVAAGETEQGKCLECAAEHKKLADWLKELLSLRAQQTTRNAPLTLEELREMDGEPVWNDSTKNYMLVDASWWDGIGRATDSKGKFRLLDDRYYRRKPEERTE